MGSRCTRVDPATVLGVDADADAGDRVKTRTDVVVGGGERS